MTKDGSSYIVRGASADEFEMLLVRAADDSTCFLHEMYSDGDINGFETKHMAGDALNTYPVNGYIEYQMVGETKSHLASFNGFGVLWRSYAPECRGIDMKKK